MFEVKINNKIYPFSSLKIVREVNPPESFEIVIPSLEDINIGDEVEIYRNDSKIFKGLVERKVLSLNVKGLSLTLHGRDLSQKLSWKITGQKEYANKKVKDIVSDILSLTDLTLGEVEDPFPVYARWIQETDEDFNVNTFNDTKVYGSGVDAYISLTDSKKVIVSENTGTTNSVCLVNSDMREAQSFKLPEPGFITGVEVYASNEGVTAICELKDSLTGGVLDSAQHTQVESGWITFNFEGENYTPANSTRYIVFHSPDATSETRFCIKVDTSNPYADGMRHASGDGGNTWNNLSGEDFVIRVKYQPLSGNVVTPLIQPTNFIGWDYLDAKYELNGETLKFDVLDSADNVIVSDVDVSQLPYSLSSLTQTAVKLKAKFQTSKRGYPRLNCWWLIYRQDLVPSFKVDYDVVYDALKRLASLVNGEFWVNPDGKLYFKKTRGEDLSSTVILDSEKDYFFPSLEVDGLKIVNKVKVIGADTDTGRIEVLAEDKKSQNSYGVRENIKVDKKITDTGLAGTLAINLLNLYKNPVERVSLTFIPNKTFSIGDKVTVKCEKLNLNKVLRVKKLTINFDNKNEVWNVLLGEKPETILDEILKVRVIEEWLK